VDGTGTTSFVYDSLDRLTKMTYPDGKTVQYAYDKASNRASLTNPLPTQTTFGYDAANRLTSMVQGSLTWTFGYDAAGNRTTLGQPNGTSTVYAYQTNNWLSSITHKAPGGATLQSFAYTYDKNGNRISQADPTGTTSFAYDALNRLVNAAYPAGYGTWSWTYDPVGNRLSQNAPSGTTNYSYDANNRLTAAGVVTYSYDANGNLTSTSSGQSFAWDVFNRMTSGTGGGGTATYTYNGDGLKIRRIGPDGTTRYYHDGIRPIWEADGAGSMTAQLDRDIFGNLLSRKEPAGTRRYYHFDGLGSTTALSDEGGAAVATLLYDAWGNQRAASGATVPNYRFTGAELDSASGLYHMGARFYDPTIGRWLSEDPLKILFPLTLNFYVYASGNPIIAIDPSGLTECDLECLNKQRQELARLALRLAELLALAGQEIRAVDIYVGARELAREEGFETVRDMLKSSVGTLESVFAPQPGSELVSAPGGSGGTSPSAYRAAGLTMIAIGLKMLGFAAKQLLDHKGWGLLDHAFWAFAMSGMLMILAGTNVLICGCAPRRRRVRVS
jgi:RHS repeat-associated protein